MTGEEYEYDGDEDGGHADVAPGQLLLPLPPLPPLQPPRRAIGTPGVSCQFADVHAKTRKSRAEVGQNIITVDSALFKFTVAKISNSDFYSK